MSLEQKVKHNEDRISMMIGGLSVGYIIGVLLFQLFIKFIK